MTNKERAIKALTLQKPDRIPTFELEYQLEEEVFGKKFLNSDDLRGKSKKERDYLMHEGAEYYIKVYSSLEYSIIPVHYFNLEDLLEFTKILRKMVKDEYMLTTHGDGTFAIPDGNEMYEFAYSIADDPDGVKNKALKMAKNAIETNKKKMEAGIDCFILCADYCYNSGPFISPEMFSEYITPYLEMIISQIRKDGMYAIKHTDGNIMPIIDQLVSTKPHAIHSLDPMAGIDIKEVKDKYGDQVCLCGNVNCALLQTGTKEEIVESAKYAIDSAKPNGGYIYCTSNVPFKGMDPANYEIVLDVWRKNRDY